MSLDVAGETYVQTASSHTHCKRIFLTAQTMVMMTEEDRWDRRLGWVDETLMDNLIFCLNTNDTTVANVSPPLFDLRT